MVAIFDFIYFWFFSPKLGTTISNNSSERKLVHALHSIVGRGRFIILTTTVTTLVEKYHDHYLPKPTPR